MDGITTKEPCVVDLMVTVRRLFAFIDAELEDQRRISAELKRGTEPFGVCRRQKRRTVRPSGTPST